MIAARTKSVDDTRALAAEVAALARPGDLVLLAGDLGVGELLDQGGVTLIEWGDVVAPILPADFLEVRLELGEGEEERTLRLRPIGPSWSVRVDALRGALERWLVED